MLRGITTLSTNDLTQRWVGYYPQPKININFMSTNATILHPVLLKLSEGELLELETLASHYELSEGELIHQALRHYLAELDVCLIPVSAAV
jgi:hypothetical protein